MENPYEGYHFQSYTPQSEQEPESSGYAGNTPLATVSLVMGILSILSVCCFPPALFIFSGLGILFSCLSKGEHTRPGTAKAGMAICTSCLVILTSAVIIVCSLFLSTDRGRSFLHDYMDLITSGELDEENLYDFMEKYFPDYYNYSGDSLPDSTPPYNFDGGGSDGDSPFYGDDSPGFYQQPDSDYDGNFI